MKLPRKMSLGDLHRATGKRPCDRCGDQVATQKYEGDDLCGGCVAFMRQR